jgi:hypothetical protein
MFSVIIPTMWRYKPFVKFLNDLQQCPLVDHIDIIDNDNARRPRDLPYELDGGYLAQNGSPKILFWIPGRNIYVNPAWNAGVAGAKNDKICILNDDFLFDLRVFYRVDKLLDDLKAGVIGTAPGDHPTLTGQPKLTTGAIDIIPHTNQHLWGFGYAMFLHKRNWEPIPEDIKVFAGDNWIFDGCKQKGLTNYLITNFFWRTPGSVTAGPMEKEFGDRDKALYAKYNTERMNRHV